MSVAAGLRHSLAVTGKCTLEPCSEFRHFTANPHVLIIDSASRLRLCIPVGDRSFQSCQESPQSTPCPITPLL